MKVDDDRERSDRSDGEVIAGWVSTHATLSISLATFLFVVFQVYKAAGFDGNSTVELLRAGGLSEVVVGALFVQFSIELVLLTLGAAWWLMAVDRPDPGRRPPGSITRDARAPAAAILVTLAVLGFWTSPWPLWLLGVTISALAFGISSGRSPRWAATETWVRRAILGGAGILLLILVQRPTIWVPAERVATTDRGIVVAYVIADDGAWTTLLTPDHQVLREKSTRITQRSLCALDQLEARLFADILRLRPAELYDTVRLWAIPPSHTPPCPAAST